MAFQFDRWLRYSKAKVRDALSSGNRELDRLEAEREAEREDKPWLSRDGEDLSFDQVKARIEWQEEKNRERARQVEAEAEGSPGGGSDGTSPDGRDGPPSVRSDRAKPAGASEDGAPEPDAGREAVGGERGPEGERGEGQDGTGTRERVDPKPSEPPAPSTPTADAGAGEATRPPLRDPAEVSADAEAEMARLELEARDRASRDRLEAIRRELGLEPPSEGT